MADDGVREATSPDPSTIELFLRMFHNSAADEHGAVFVLVAIDPETKKVSVCRFAIGDVQPMVARARTWSHAGANVYFPPVLYRKDLPNGKRGTFEDIVAVLGVALDDEPDIGKGVTLPPGLGPTTEIITSMGRVEQNPVREPEREREREVEGDRGGAASGCSATVGTCRNAETPTSMPKAATSSCGRRRGMEIRRFIEPRMSTGRAIVHWLRRTKRSPTAFDRLPNNLPEFAEAERSE